MRNWTAVLRSTAVFLISRRNYTQRGRDAKEDEKKEFHLVTELLLGNILRSRYLIECLGAALNEEKSRK